MQEHTTGNSSVSSNKESDRKRARCFPCASWLCAVLRNSFRPLSNCFCLRLSPSSPLRTVSFSPIQVLLSRTSCRIAFPISRTQTSSGGGQSACLSTSPGENATRPVASLSLQFSGWLNLPSLQCVDAVCGPASGARALGRHRISPTIYVLLDDDISRRWPGVRRIPFTRTAVRAAKDFSFDA